MILKRRRIPLEATIPTEPDEWKNGKLALREDRHWSTPGYGTPPILVRDRGGAYEVLDGHHRRLAAIRSGRTHIMAYVIPYGFFSWGNLQVRWRGCVLNYNNMWSGDWRRAVEEDGVQC